MHANRPVSGFSRVLASLNCDGRFGLALLAACGLLRSEEHTSELQSRLHLVCRLLLEKKKKIQYESNFFFCICTKFARHMRGILLSGLPLVLMTRCLAINPSNICQTTRTSVPFDSPGT